MGAITVRNLPPEVARRIRQKAKKERISMNRAVVSLLEKAVGVSSAKEKQEEVYHDLDRFFGVWSREEYEEFMEALREQRQIEPEA